MESMDFAGSLALVVPTLNEADNIGTLLDAIQQALRPTNIRYIIIVVDDSSTDGTPHVVRKHMRRDDRIKLLERTGKNGLAGAILDGWAHNDADLLGVMDADLQHPPALLPDLLAAVKNGADIAIGLRHGCTGLEPGNGDKSMRASIIDDERIALPHGRAHVDGAAKIELRRKDSSNGVDGAIQRDGFSQCSSAAGKALFPQPLTDHRHRCSAGLVLFGREVAAENR